MQKSKRGGKRPGAGRPKGSSKASPATRAKARMPAAAATVPAAAADSAPAQVYESAEAYLAAVVAGTETPDLARIAAARAILPFQKRRERAPLKSAAPKQLANAESMQKQQAARDAWLAKSAAVRAKHERKS